MIFDVIHYGIVLILFLFGMFYRHTKFTIFSVTIRFYLLISLWLIVCYISGGCPLTYAEIYTCKLLGLENPYPCYTFDESFAKYVLYDTYLYTPLIILLCYKGVTNYLGIQND